MVLLLCAILGKSFPLFWASVSSSEQVVGPHLGHPRMLCRKSDAWKESKARKDSLGLVDDA